MGRSACLLRFCSLTWVPTAFRSSSSSCRGQAAFLFLHRSPHRPWWLRNKGTKVRLLCRPLSFPPDSYSPTLKPHPPQARPHPHPAFGRLSPLPRGAFSSGFRLEIHQVQLSCSRRHFPETLPFHLTPSHAPIGIPVSIRALLGLSGRCLSMHCPSLVKQSYACSTDVQNEQESHKHLLIFSPLSQE